MSNIEKIKAEIERQRSFIEGLFIEGDNSFYDGQDDAYNHLLAFIDSLPEEKLSDDLEEAASRGGFDYVDEIEAKAPGLPWNDHDVEFGYRDGFIAGAEWQRKHSPLPEDTVLFQKGVEEGKRLMMEEAVGGEIVKNVNNKLALHSRYVNLDKFHFGDKVKIIIVKQ